MKRRVHETKERERKEEEGGDRLCPITPLSLYRRLLSRSTYKVRENTNVNWSERRKNKNNKRIVMNE
ncbi:hypothetical protein J6590_071998 [Homalodisca vitripennis]|nr:hypothetical protein J6590_071998 [Homalodisca vitripennis]